jgi:hypothetical protein
MTTTNASLTKSPERAGVSCRYQAGITPVSSEYHIGISCIVHVVTDKERKREETYPEAKLEGLDALVGAPEVSELEPDSDDGSDSGKERQGEGVPHFATEGPDACPWRRLRVELGDSREDDALEHAEEPDHVVHLVGQLLHALLSSLQLPAQRFLLLLPILQRFLVACVPLDPHQILHSLHQRMVFRSLHGYTLLYLSSGVLFLPHSLR